MSCREKLIHALTQTHLALISCSECIYDDQPKEEQDTIRNMCVLLAEQARVLQDKLLQQSCGD